MRKFPPKTAASAAASISTASSVPTADEVDAYSIDEFCDRHRISRATFYNLRDQGLAPTLMHVGARILISVEAAEAWRRKMEAADKATATS